MLIFKVIFKIIEGISNKKKNDGKKIRIKTKRQKRIKNYPHSTVTHFARFLGLSGSSPLATLM